MKRWYPHPCGVCRITVMFDVDGDRTEDPARAVTIVAEMPDGQWLAAECDVAQITEQAP